MMDVLNVRSSHASIVNATKVLRPTGVIAALAGIFMLLAGSIVHAQEKDHAATSSVSFRRSSILLQLAGICSFAGCLVVMIVTCCKGSSESLSTVKKGTLTFAVLLALAAFLAIVAAILGFIDMKKVNIQMEPDLISVLKEYGKTGESLKGLDTVQSTDQCCGVIDYTDWRQTIYGGNRYDKVPDSCCKEDKHGCGFEFKYADINKQGCLDVVIGSVTKHLRIVAVGGIIIGLIEIVFVGITCYIYKKILS